MAITPISALLAQSFEDGQSAYQEGRLDVARSIWSALAEEGDAGAQHRLAQMLAHGQGGPIDEDAAYQWFLAAAGQGLRDAQFELAEMLDAGRGAPADPIGASVWFARAAAHGHARAQLQMALRYQRGLGAPLNPRLALAWARLAAETMPEAAALRDQLLNAPNGPKGRLGPPVPITDARVIAYGRDRASTAVELVWTTPPQPQNSRFFLQVKRLTNSAPETAFAGYLDRSAAVVTLDPQPAAYIWRVLSLSPSDGDYAASDWLRFDVNNPQKFSKSIPADGHGPDLRRFQVVFRYDRLDDAAQRLAADLTADFTLSGLTVDGAVQAQPKASAVRYFYNQDREMAEAVASMLPALDGAASFASPAEEVSPPYPGSIEITLRGGRGGQ